jgi:hypothetical protein
MCTVSNIGDYGRREWDEWIKYPGKLNPVPGYYPQPVVTPPKDITREEFEALKKRVEALHELLLAAKKYDEQTDQPHCEADDKVAVIKKIAEYFGVDMKDVFDHD